MPVPVERSIQGSGIWTLVEGQTAKALPGQKINLRLQDLYLSLYGPPGVTLNDWQWDIPDKSFRDYVVVFSDIDSATSGILTPFDKTETYCKEKDIYFYWSTSGAKPPNVGFEVLVGSEPFGHTSSTATMLVEKVDSRLTTKTGENKVAVLPPPFPEVQAFGFFSKAVGGDKYGIDYTGSVTTPSGWPAGKWNWVQLVKSHREFHNTTGTHTGMGDGTTSKLDTFYPYKPEPYSGNPLVAGSYPADASEHIDHDLPSEPLFGRVSIEVHETFETYLMFLPPGSGSRYVPLQQVGWVWGGIVSSADGWQAVTAQDQAAPVNPGGVEYSDHPQWDGNTKSDKEALIQ